MNISFHIFLLLEFSLRIAPIPVKYNEMGLFVDANASIRALISVSLSWLAIVYSLVLKIENEFTPSIIRERKSVCLLMKIYLFSRIQANVMGSPLDSMSVSSNNTFVSTFGRPE